MAPASARRRLRAVAQQLAAAHAADNVEVPHVIVIGDDESKKLYQPKPKDLERFPGLKLMHKMPIDCYRSPPITCSFFERVPLSGGSS